MQTTLIDSGPCIALFDASDNWHRRVVSFMSDFRGQLMTSWAAITEVSHMLDFNLQVQLDFLEWIERGAVKLALIEQTEIYAIRRMMHKYTDVPMNLADASLLYLAEREGIKNVVSIDSDFSIYRTRKKQPLTNLLDQ
ncbi:MAG: hypothetical protein L0H29_07770 [Sinobacteraceae bacterium]|nr:hypothetical protein [Nevskiaceae bacterium]